MSDAPDRFAGLDPDRLSALAATLVADDPDEIEPLIALAERLLHAHRVRAAGLAVVAAYDRCDWAALSHAVEGLRRLHEEDS